MENENTNLAIYWLGINGVNTETTDTTKPEKVTVETVEVENNKNVVILIETKNSKNSKENASKEVSNELSSSKRYILLNLSNVLPNERSTSKLYQKRTSGGKFLPRNFVYQEIC